MHVLICLQIKKAGPCETEGHVVGKRNRDTQFENVINNLPENARRVAERAGSSDHTMYSTMTKDHMMCTKNIKEKQKNYFGFDYRYCNITIITLMHAYTWIYRMELSGEPSKQCESSAVNLKDCESNHYSEISRSQ